MSLANYVLKKAIEYKDNPKKWVEFFDNQTFEAVMEMCLQDIRREEKQSAWREFRTKAMQAINYLE